MSDENGDRLQVRIAVGCAFTSVGAALAVVAMTSILQPEPCPWWAILLLILGGITLIAGLLVLIVPPRRWKKLWHSVWGLPKWFHNTCYWKCHGPRCNIGDPIFKPSEISEIGHDDYEAKITATVMVWIKNKSKPIKVNLSSTNVCLEQKVGWREQKARFPLYVHQGIPEIMLKPHEEWCDQILVSLIHRGNGDSLPDIKKRSRCGVRGICITLPKGGERHLHKGTHCQPAHNEIIV